MQVYFSHSYRDETVNAHFRRCFEDEEIALGADQKTDIWCVAKLERYLGEIAGFVSIIPRRVTDTDPGAYSAYIGQELNLARRARVPRLLFVDELVYRRHRLDFPEDAVEFRPDALDEGNARFVAAVQDFGKTLETTYRPPRAARAGEAAVIIGAGKRLHREAARDVEEVLQRAGYAVTRPLGNDPEHGLNDIRLLESLWRAEVCVFLLGERLSDAHLALAMAHAHCIPSIRLRYEEGWTDCSPSLSGVVRWSVRDDMLVELTRQLESYQSGLVRPTRDTSRMRWQPKEEQLWRLDDGPGLLAHVRPEHVFVGDEVRRAANQLGKAVGRLRSREECFDLFRVFYEGIQRHHFAYEIEAVSGVAGVQAIRSPTNIATHRTATCIDIACLFASLLENAGQNPLLVVVEGPNFAHALAGYRAHGEPAWETNDLGDLRGAVARGDAVLFEVTGATEADSPVGAELPDERHDKLLSFQDARNAAERLLRREGLSLRHYLDVRDLRERGTRVSH
ncbi:hypothetical protein J421_5011 (plasmid) [Gemmatirosa kalamazoonensis]|uniref:TIR domain-containing protein n=1 Tax=Gemmatirosa kalamazoonensis TaxID=861299 RepID=W0RP84_9BACT|nr:hypothetical protein [Gemmatirosa kalamazoonensis]AHG92546.1 hypothetical protein J421_5011 [Gemmatirosa kalamazoonensis]